MPTLPKLTLLEAQPADRQTLLRHLLLDLPTCLTKKQATVSGLARSLDISRITASAFFNMPQAQFPLSLKMAVRLALATRHYLPNIQPLARSFLRHLYPTSPQEWLALDAVYQDPPVEAQIEELTKLLSNKIKPLAAYTRKD